MIVDPGIGFGKTPEQNLQLINGLDRLAAEFSPPRPARSVAQIFIKRTLDRRMTAIRRDEAGERLAGTAASIAVGLLRGARIVRVHDVGPAVALVRMVEALVARA